MGKRLNSEVAGKELNLTEQNIAETRSQWTSDPERDSGIFCRKMEIEFTSLRVDSQDTFTKKNKKRHGNHFII